MSSPLVFLLNQSRSPGWLKKICTQMNFFHRHEVHDEGAGTKNMLYGGEALKAKLTSMLEATDKDLIVQASTTMVSHGCV
jgi:hypothetical protein